MKCSGGLCKEDPANSRIHNEFDANVLWEVHMRAAFQVYSKTFCSDGKNETNKQTTEYLNTKAN